MKIYAELHGDMQMPRIKSRGDNISDISTMNYTDNLACMIEEAVTPKLHIVDSIKESVNAASAILAERMGDRPYWVNSVNISLRRH